MHTLRKFSVGLIILCSFLFATTLAYALPSRPAQLPTERSDPRIVGGYEATEGAWPWMAALVATGTPPTQGQFCGGSLIEPNWVVTAAHCVDGYNAAQKTQVYLGIHDLNDTSAAEKIAVKNVIIHPNYDQRTLDYDIALLELAESSSFETIDMVPQDDPQYLTAVGTYSRVIGWGTTSYGANLYSDVLLEVEVPIISLQDAITAYTPLSYTVTDNMLAAGYEEGGRDACSGDSGGPLMVPNGDDWALAGLVSWGEGCAEPEYPGMYTRVSNFTDWVNSNVSTTHEYYIPYATYDANQWMGVALSNIENSVSNEVEVKYYENDGDLIGSEDLTLAARGQTSFMAPNTTGSTGWIYIISEEPLRGLAFLGGPDEKPMYDLDMQDSLSETILASHLDLTPERWDSTIMACNPSDSEISLTFTLYKTDGTHLTPDVTQNIPAMGAAQIKINNLFPGHTSTGSLKITSTGDGIAGFLLYDGTQTGNNWRAGLSVLPE